MESRRALGSSRTAPCQEYGHTGFRQLRLSKVSNVHHLLGYLGRTVYPLAKFDDLSQRHCLTVFSGKMRKNTRAQCDLLVEIALRETVLAELEFGGFDISQVGVQDTKGV